MDVKVGDYIQWECGGVYVFPEARRVSTISDCGEFCFVENSDGCGVPVSQVIILPNPNDKPLEKFTFFYSNKGPKGPFSQWFMCPMRIGGVNYNCCEQFMMAMKARFFQDEETLRKIMLARQPKDQKAFGRDVHGFVKSKWDGVCKEIVYKGNYAKFTQHAEHKKLLLDTKGTTLVEASRTDDIWGIGLAEDDPRAQRRETWLGTNWLGEVLTKLREDLIRNAK